MAGGTAVLVATAPAADGTAAAGLRFAATTLLGRLLEQLADLGIREAHVITRTPWAAALEAAARDHGVAVRLHLCAGSAADLRAVAAIARDGAGPLVIAN